MLGNSCPTGNRLGYEEGLCSLDGVSIQLILSWAHSVSFLRNTRSIDVSSLKCASYTFLERNRRNVVREDLHYKQTVEIFSVENCNPLLPGLQTFSSRDLLFFFSECYERTVAVTDVSGQTFGPTFSGKKNPRTNRLSVFCIRCYSRTPDFVQVLYIRLHIT